MPTVQSETEPEGNRSQIDRTVTNAPSTFQKALDILLGSFKWKSCLVYLDDVIIFSQNTKDHLRDVDEVLTALREAGVSLKLAKCNFFTDTVRYFGHVIKPGTMEVEEASKRALKGLRPPRTGSELKSFLGLCNVYRRFIRDYTLISILSLIHI